MAITITESGRLVVTIGRRGVPGVGVIAGGTTGQVLSKASATDYDMEWSAAGSGDMASAVYDPTSVAGDAFDMENMAEGATNKILSSAERTQLTALTGAAGGTTGQIATKASGDDYDLTWSDNLTVPGLLTANHIHGNIAGTLYIHVKNTSGGTLAKGTPVYVTGHVGSSDRAEVAAADQSDPAKMPAIALLAEDLANNGEGDGVIVGEIRTFDTDTPGYSLNDELFVGTGALTATKPTSGAVQPVATVGRLQASTGVLVINCQGQRSPDETFAPALGADDNYVTDAEKVVIGNTSGTNTGDQDLSGYALTSSLGTAAASDTGDFEASGAVSTHAAITSGVHGISTFGATLIDDADAATARATLGVDAAGTDNSTDVTLAGSLDYLSLSGQQITLGSVDLTTDVTGTLPAANGGTGVTALTSLNLNTLGSGAATDGYVATADGAGGVAWEAASGGGGNWTDVSTNVVELRDGATATAIYTYNTYTDASNYERGFLKWDSNQISSGMESAGTGVTRDYVIKLNGSQYAWLSGDTFHANVVIGFGATSSSGYQGVAIGKSSNAARYAFAGGGSANASQYNTVALGFSSVATSKNSSAIGNQAKAERVGQTGLVRGDLPSLLSHNRGNLGIRVQTTDGTATAFTSIDNDNFPLLVPDERLLSLSGEVVAQKSDGSVIARWSVDCLAKRDSGTLTLPFSSVTADYNPSGWTLAVSADDVNKCIKFELTAEATVNAAGSFQFVEQATTAI